MLIQSLELAPVPVGFQAMKEAAFESSACPVVITLENYLSPEGQRRAKFVKGLRSGQQPKNIERPFLMLQCFKIFQVQAESKAKNPRGFQTSSRRCASLLLEVLGDSLYVPGHLTGRI